MKISITDNFALINKQIDALAKKNRAATIKAVNATAHDVKYALKKEMQKVFDRPTPWTLNSTYVKPATNSNLGAAVGIKDFAAKGTAAAEYLKPQIQGGGRANKRFETALLAYGLMPASSVAVPAAGAKLNPYGNVRKGQINQIISQLRVQLTAGYESRASGSKRSNATIARQKLEYFALPRGRGKLKPGIYSRSTTRRNSGALLPVFIFVSKAKYRARLDFFGVAERTTVANFPSNLAAAQTNAFNQK